jgi:hypothetical protein
MSRIHFSIATLAVMMMSALPARAQTTAGLNEIGTQGSVDATRQSNSTERQTSIDLNVYYGRFVTDRIEIGPAWEVTKFEGSPAQGSIGGFIDFYFGDTSHRLLPYIEGGAGQIYGVDGGRPTYFAAGPGIKWFFANGGGALNATALFSHQRYPKELSNSAFTGFNDVVVSIGAALYFGR